jgi:hypothetical protein
MNRRDALKVTTGITGLIAGTSLAADQPQVRHPNLSWDPQPHYWVLYIFQTVPVNDFIPAGVYTKREDAEDHQRRIRESLNAGQIKSVNREAYAGVILEESHEQLCYRLADIRLAAIAEHMRKLLGQPVPLHKGMDLREHRELAMLYSKSEFPQLYAEKTD